MGERKLTLEEVQAEELVLLKEFDTICEDNGFRYWLAAGSCLGAVRHGGFIPWDDDTDVYMPRPDYERLKGLAPMGEVGFLLPATEAYPWCFGKYVSKRTTFDELWISAPADYGVFLDIFPLDGLPDNDPVKPLARARKLYRRYQWAYCFDWSKAENCGMRGVAKRILGIMARAVPRDCYLHELDGLSMLGEFSSCDYVATFGSSYPAERDYYDKSRFFDGYSLCDYEGLKLRVPTDAEGYLEQLYGPAWVTPIQREHETHGTAYWRKGLSYETDSHLRYL